MSETIEIERMAFGSEAVGHLSSGKAVFVAYAAPGDITEIEIIEDKPKFARARILNLLEPSPNRAPSADTRKCDMAQHAMAPWAHLSYEAQLAAKQLNVKSALKRNAHMPNDQIQAVLREIVPSKNQWGYRNKLEFSTKLDSQGKICIGVNAEGTHDFVPLKEAPLGNTLLRKSPHAIQGALRYLCGNDDLGIYRVGVRGSENTQSVEVALWTPPSSFPRSFTAKVLKDAFCATSIVRVLADANSSRKVKRVEVLDGDGFWKEQLHYEVGSASPADAKTFDFSVTAPSFFQVNSSQAQTMISLVLEGLNIKPGCRVADLYSGVGTFSLPLALAGANLVSVELEGSSSRDFRRNLELNSLDGEVICDDVARVLPTLINLDALVLDPPRSGLDKKVVGQLASTRPEKIAYVSCDVQTFARDVQRLEQAGFHLRRLTPLDMFPQTYHTECVGVFARG